MSDRHFLIQCKCGAIIAQCRCISGEKTVEIVNSCKACYVPPPSTNE